MKKRKLRIFLIITPCAILVLFLYILAYNGSNTVAPTSQEARLDLNVLGFQTPLTPGVVRTWNAIFFPLRYIDAATTPEETIHGVLVPPPFLSTDIFIKSDTDSMTHWIQFRPDQGINLDAFSYGQKIVATVGMGLDTNLDPAGLSKGGRPYLKSLRAGL